MFAVGPEEEPVSEPEIFPVTLPETFPKSVPLMVALLRTKRFVAVAVPLTTRLVVDAVFATVIEGVVMVPVAVSVPIVDEPMVEEEPVMLPVTEPVRFPVMVFDTTRFVVVAVPETTSCEVEAEDVAVRVPMVAFPRVAEAPVMREEM
jgi:hypothetical protein